MVRLFSAKFRYGREQRAWSQADIAHLLDLSRGSVNNLEAGRKQPSLATVVRTAKLFGIPLDDLLRDSVTPEQMRINTAITTMIALESFGFSLYSLRTAAGHTQHALAHHLGLSTQAYISLLEHGQKYPSPDVALLIADYFQIMVDTLFLNPVLL